MRPASATDLIFNRYELMEYAHPNTLSPKEWNAAITPRLMDLLAAITCDQNADPELAAGQRALQIAGIMLRIIKNLDLGLVRPTYDVGALGHAE